MSSAQNQDVVPISSYDTAGSFLILGCNNGSIYYIGECSITATLTPERQDAPWWRAAVQARLIKSMLR